MMFEAKKSELATAKLKAEADMKKMLMDHEFELNIRMKKMEMEQMQEKDLSKNISRYRQEDSPR